MEVDGNNSGGSSAQPTTEAGVLSSQDIGATNFTTMFSPVGMAASAHIQPLLVPNFTTMYSSSDMGVSTNTQSLLQPNFTTTYSPANIGVSTNNQPLLQPNFTNTYSPTGMGVSTNTQSLQQPNFTATYSPANMGVSTNTQPLLQPNFTNTYSPANMGISTNTHPLQSPGNYNIIRSHQSNLPTGMRGAIAPGNETVETVIMEYLGVKIRGRQHLLSHIMDPQVFFGKPRSRAFARRLLAPKAREPNSTVTTDDASTSKASEEDQWTSDLDAEEDSDSLVRKMKQLEQRVRLRAPRSSNKTRGITKATRPLSGQLSHNHRGMLGRACQRIQTDEEEKRRNVTEMGQGDINSILQKMQAGVSVNMSDSSGRTPLHVACIGRNATTVYMLLHMGAPVNVVDNLGNTPLTLAAISLSISIVLLLLEAGADPRLGNGLVKVVTMLRSRINLMRANIQSSLDNERRYFVLDDNTRSRMRESRSRAAHVIIECLKIVTLLGALARKADSSSPCPYAQYESARSEASEPAILSAEAAGQLDELSSLFNSLDLVPSQTTSPTQQSSATSNNENAASDHIQTTNNADSSSLKENEVDTKMVELLDKFALLLGEDSSKS